MHAADSADLRPATADALCRAWDLELKSHFDMEEELLGPLCTEEERLRLGREHAWLGALFGRIIAGEAESDLLRNAGQGLDDHIRWEERELFIHVEESTSEERLAELAKRTWDLEMTRWGTGLAPRREELVRKPVKDERQ